MDQIQQAFRVDARTRWVLVRTGADWPPTGDVNMAHFRLSDPKA